MVVFYQSLLLQSIAFIFLMQGYQCFDKQFPQNLVKELSDICDPNITQQLQQQNINFQCELGQIYLQNMPSVQFNLVLKEVEVYSTINIQNINQVTINKLILVDVKSKIHRFNCFINISNISRLSIQTFSAEYSVQNEEILYLLNISGTQNTEIGQFQVFSELEGLSNGYQILVVSESLSIGEIFFQNIYSFSLQINGIKSLDIDTINIIQKSFDDQKYVFLGYSFCQFLSSNIININNIQLEVNDIQQQKNRSGLVFAEFKIENNQEFSNNTMINIGKIIFKSSGILKSSFGVIQFESEQQYTVLNIDNILHQQISSEYHFQLQAYKIKDIKINQLVFQGFGNQELRNYNRNNIFFRLQNIINLNIQKITFIQNNLVYGTLFDGSIYQLQIFNFQIQPDNQFFKPLIYLQNSNYVNIQGLSVEEAQFYDYLFKFYDVQSLKLFQFKINKIYFEKESLFYISQVIGFNIVSFQLKQIQIIEKQATIFYIDTSNLIQNTMYDLFGTQANLKVAQNRLQFINYFGSPYLFRLTNSEFSNCNSFLFGGCFNFFNPIVSEEYLSLINTTFTNCHSQYLGGAISGIRVQLLENSKISNCSSMIGGAIYTKNYQTVISDTNSFYNNSGYLAANNYNTKQVNIRLESINEIILNSDGSTQFLKVNKYLYPGLTYLILIQISVDDIWYTSYNKSTYFGNIYELLVSPNDNYSPNTPQYLQNIYNPFILWQGKNINFFESQTQEFQINEINFDTLYKLNTNQYQIYNGCKDGMQKVYFDSQDKEMFICMYCSNMTVGYNGMCESCQKDYFSDCYANISVLKQNYWRSNLTVNPSDILFCNNNPQNCIGGQGQGNELCYQGHIGAQCLNCDIKGNYWGEKYSQIGLFQCTKCSGISSNTTKVIILILILALSLIIIIISMFKRLENQLYATYLSKMGIFFFGQTLRNQQLSSAYIKILLFHAQIFMISHQFTKVDILSTFSNLSFLFYSPLSSPFLSLNCIISQTWPTVNTGYSNIMLTFMIPILLCSLIALYPIILFVLKQKNIKKSLYITFLSFIYVFITVFDSILLEKTLSSFFCLDLDRGKSYSLIDLSLECGNSTELKEIQTLSLVILCVFLITIPIIVFICLVQQRNRLKKVRVMYTFGFLYNEYKQKFYFWEIVRFIVRYLLILISLSLKENPQIALIMITLLEFSYFIALKSFNPFISLFLNRLEKASIIISVISLLSSNMYLQQNQNENQQIYHFRLAFYMIVQTVNLIFMVFNMWITIISFLEQQIYKLKKYFQCKFFKRIKQVNIIRINKNIKTLKKYTKKIKLSYKLTDENTYLFSSFEFDEKY